MVYRKFQELFEKNPKLLLELVREFSESAGHQVTQGSLAVFLRGSNVHMDADTETTRLFSILKKREILRYKHWGKLSEGYRSLRT